MTRNDTATRASTSRVTAAGTEYEPGTAHYHHRKIDGKYEVVVRARVREDLGDPEWNQKHPAPWRWVAMDVKDRREDAVARVREIREGNA